MKKLTTITLGSLLISTLLLTGCIKSDPTLTKAWELDGFNNPESIVFDSKNEVFYVSNRGAGGPTAKDENGFIAKVEADGKMQTLEWITGLNAPKGTALKGNTLYVADIDEVVEIDIINGVITNKYTATDAEILNDVTIDSKGDIYISDTRKSAIYKLSNGSLELWIEDMALEQPNGLYAEKDQLIVASWGIVTDPATWGTDVPGHVKTVSLADKKIQPLGNTNLIGNMDGIERDEKGNYFVSNWRSGEIFYLRPNGEVKTLTKLDRGAADLVFTKEKKLLVVPVAFENKIVAYKVN